jgi:SAM-dependent methyltransferase
MDPIAQFKQNQKQGWSTFAPFEIYTCGPAARLVTFAQIAGPQRVLDVGCGTGVVALAAARTGAQVTGLDLTPELLLRARENAALAGASIEWNEGDAEALPFGDATFDVVLSQFGHMFAPRPEVATAEMLRVLKPGGRIAFATWPPELYTGSMFRLVGQYLPPPPPGVSPPPLWGAPDVVRERLGSAVTELVFDRGALLGTYLSVPHVRAFLESGAGPVKKVVSTLEGDPARLAAFRRDLDALTVQYFEPTQNVLRQDYLLTRARKLAG